MQNNGMPNYGQPAADKVLRLLCAEDNPRDLKLITEILKKAGYRLALDAVDESRLFRERLEQGEYDLIICDFDIGDWTAIDALGIVKASGQDVPFVVVSGSMGDEAAVECIKQGATDYVLKDRMTRLPSAIQRALEARTAREEQRKAELALRQSVEQYRLLFEANPIPMWVFDAENLAILAVNEAAVRHYGYSTDEFLKMTLSDLRRPEEVPHFLAKLAGVGKQAVTMGSLGVLKHRKKSGEVIEVEVAGSPTMFHGRPAGFVLINDVTERNSLQAQFLQAQKMESLGRLAGGVAHDLNNLLGVVLGYGELAQDHLDAASPLRKNVEGMQKAADRAVSVVRQLLAFSRKQIQQPRMLSLNAIVEDMADLLHRLIGEDIKLSIATDSRLWTVRADKGQIEQVIMNLAVNARDAMPAGGQLTIRTANVELDDTDPGHELGCPTGSHVMLEIRDTGCGMDASTQAKIFEPFFTTKELGKGTGLGLATVYGIVKQSGGSISVHSKLDSGATFRICLPRVEAAPQSSSALKLSGEVPAGEVPGGSETVLLVEDAEPFREVARQFLQRGGYNVLVAEDGMAALAVSRNHHSPIHLLLTDVVLPGFSGLHLVQSLRIAHPKILVLYMSGYTDEALGPHGMLEEGIALLEKPFTRGSLLRKVREVLGPAKSSTHGEVL